MTPPARRPRGEIRAPATLVDATFCAIADAGSIPAVSTFLRWISQIRGSLWGEHLEWQLSQALLAQPADVSVHGVLEVGVIAVAIDAQGGRQI